MVCSLEWLEVQNYAIHEMQGKYQAKICHVLTLYGLVTILPKK